mmetsp:Transcript_103348/g.246128  ORF Transcript_103348/g.246128 Transcript_103348/m.246128 type:complete len:215 (-) Transcript_103348:310-954(-)
MSLRGEAISKCHPPVPTTAVSPCLCIFGKYDHSIRVVAKDPDVGRWKLQQGLAILRDGVVLQARLRASWVDNHYPTQSVHNGLVPEAHAHQRPPFSHQALEKAAELWKPRLLLGTCRSRGHTTHEDEAIVVAPRKIQGLHVACVELKAFRIRVCKHLQQHLRHFGAVGRVVGYIQVANSALPDGGQHLLHLRQKLSLKLLTAHDPCKAFHVVQR